MRMNKLIQKELEVIGGKPQVFRYWDDNEKNCIDILSCVDRPCRGVISYATIGLSDCDIGLVSDNYKLRVELLGACDEKEDCFANILASTAFEIMKNNHCEYGQIIQNVISNTNSEMKHIYLGNPFLWEGFESLVQGDRKIAWLLSVPISDQEKEYAIANGWEALEDKFEEADIDIFNLNRKSII
ncbi:suppressor of fused domain protein [Butyrivibrio sp. XB500-5]|nr:suppressor of fused domain protein [Butyrivibrio sp. XB500-5]